jgi:hypothetical protein
MKKTILVLNLFLISFGINLNAKPVDVKTAELVALNFIRLKTTSPTLKSFNHLELTHTESSKVGQAISTQIGTAYYYVFNAGSNGFIMVSADDRVSPVPAYSEESNFNFSQMPPQVAKWFESYRSQIRDAIELDLQTSKEIEEEWANLINGLSASASTKRGSVSPLVAAKWNQTGYYNSSCPYDATYSERTVTGCVATAMAQVMKYWNYPAKGTGSHSYNHTQYGTLSANFGATTYNWGSMPNTVSSSNSSVATLMYHIGVSVDMNYNVSSKGGSGAFVVSAASPVTHCTEYALKTYFGYKTSLRGILRSNYTTSSWLSTIKAELDASRPVVYAGFGNGGGHCFVADGYDNNDYIHFNWGWGGAYDGYFSINSLNPGGVGTGGGTGGYNNGHQAVIGIQPESGGTGTSMDIRLYADVVVNPDPVSYNGSFTVTTNMANYGTSSSQNFSGDLSAAVFNSDNAFIGFVETKTGMSLAFNSYYVNPLVFSSTGMSSLTPGTYKVGIYFKQTGATNWTALSDGNYQNFVTFEVAGNTTNTMKLYAGLTTKPGVLVQNQSFTVTFDVANYANSDFNGDISVDIHNSDGKWIKELDVKTNLSLPALSHFVNGLTYTITDGLDLEPGTYQFFVWDKPSGGSWQVLGSGNYANPITVQLVKPGLTPDIYEVNNTLNQAFNIPLAYKSNIAKKTTVGSNCHDGTDYDYYKIDLPAGYTYSINAKIHDSYKSSNGQTYTLDALISYSTDGSTWSDVYDDVITSPIIVNGSSTVYFLVSPYFTGAIGTYLLDLNVTRTPNSSINAIHAESKFKVYPNPAQDLFTIELNEGFASEVKVINALGQVIYTEVSNGQQFEIQSSDFPAGVYLVQVKTEDGEFSQTIVIQ